jgi:hypothetical protein
MFFAIPITTLQILRVTFPDLCTLIQAPPCDHRYCMEHTLGISVDRGLPTHQAFFSRDWEGTPAVAMVSANGVVMEASPIHRRTPRNRLVWERSFEARRGDDVKCVSATCSTLCHATCTADDPGPSTSKTAPSSSVGVSYLPRPFPKIPSRPEYVENPAYAASSHLPPSCRHECVEGGPELSLVYAGLRRNALQLAASTEHWAQYARPLLFEPDEHGVVQSQERCCTVDLRGGSPLLSMSRSRSAIHEALPSLDQVRNTMCSEHGTRCTELSHAYPVQVVDTDLSGWWTAVAVSFQCSAPGCTVELTPDHVPDPEDIGGQWLLFVRADMALTSYFQHNHFFTPFALLHATPLVHIYNEMKDRLLRQAHRLGSSKSEFVRHTLINVQRFRLGFFIYVECGLLAADVSKLFDCVVCQKDGKSEVIFDGVAVAPLRTAATAAIAAHEDKENDRLLHLQRTEREVQKMYVTSLPHFSLLALVLCYSSSLSYVHSHSLSNWLHLAIAYNCSLTLLVMPTVLSSQNYSQI